jgi:hypothetical protein
MLAEGAVVAVPGCDNADDTFDIGKGHPDASLSDGASASDAGGDSVTCSSENVCKKNSDCFTAACDCNGQVVNVSDRCVVGCCLSFYETCLRACADAGGVPEAGTEAGADVGTDGGVDASVDAGADVGVEAGADAGNEEAGAEAGPDAAPDAGTDAGAGAETGTEAGTDAGGADAGAD